MTPQHAEVEQICEAGIVTLFSEDDKRTNELAIATAVQATYKNIIHRARIANKALMNVAQTISTESMQVGDGQQIIYILTLVGTVVDAELIKQQQRLQQFDPRTGRNH